MNELMDMRGRAGDWARPAVALTVADVIAMGSLVDALPPDECTEAARRAMAVWGLAGVGVRRGADWVGVMLIAPSDGLPRGHPLCANGLDRDTAGVILACTDPSVPAVAVGKRLLVGLSRRMRGQVTGIEAQASPLSALATPLAPSGAWLSKLGFQRMRYPLNRYRLECASLVVWLQRHVQPYRPHAVRLATRPAPANRVGGK